MRIRHFLPPTYRELRRSHLAFVESANLAVMWSYKSACTTVIKWVFQQNGLLDEAMAYNSWVHKYRLHHYQKSERYLSRLNRLLSGAFDVVKVVRDPLDRAVSSYIHAYRHGYDDEAIAKVVERPVARHQRFSFREFVTYLEQSDLHYCNPHHCVQVRPIERHVLFRTRPTKIIEIEQGLNTALSELEVACLAAFARVAPDGVGREGGVRRRAERGHRRRCQRTCAQRRAQGGGFACSDRSRHWLDRGS